MDWENEDLQKWRIYGSRGGIEEWWELIDANLQCEYRSAWIKWFVSPESIEQKHYQCLKRLPSDLRPIHPPLLQLFVTVTSLG